LVLTRRTSCSFSTRAGPRVFGILREDSLRKRSLSRYVLPKIASVSPALILVVGRLIILGIALVKSPRAPASSLILGTDIVLPGASRTSASRLIGVLIVVLMPSVRVVGLVRVHIFLSVD
jgi:hypothetical protein